MLKNVLVAINFNKGGCFSYLAHLYALERLFAIGLKFAYLAIALSQQLLRVF